jgi:hypothetical protein
MTSLQLVGDQQLVIEDHGDRNRIFFRGPDGRVSLSIEVTANGPILRFDGPGLAIETTGPLAINAETLSLHGRQGLTLSSGGDAGIQIAGSLESSARIQTIRAELGDVCLKANDDVRLIGERVLLNC